MDIMAMEHLYLVNNTSSSGTLSRVENTSETKGSFAKILQAENEKTCPYNFLARNGLIEYNGVVFNCDYKQNAITLGDMSDKRNVLKIYLPSGGSLHVNVNNIDQLAKAAGMFTPEDLNAIMRAIHEYNHCTRKRYEIEEEKTETAEELATGVKEL
ncbi:hypothetical protein [Butyrivibrio proteoclasticus]|uniref:hypothetical protein n=1 Tax=Butyrivibrio proteoclasticus TaxID=43305 RepID=UPI00047C295A|nr:hypothetical protein [Butyrivibrio proteoclasticus]